MQRAEAQQAPTQSPVRQGKGASVESPQGEQIAQLEAMIEHSPQMGKQAQLAAAIDASPAQAAQRLVLQAMFGDAIQRKIAGDAPLQGELKTTQFQATLNAFGVVQAKTDVKENLNDATDSETSNKLINTPTQGKKWFRFAKDGKKINSFANNITDQAPAGASPVTTTIDLEKSEEVDDPSAIPNMSRPVHFRLGDRLFGQENADYRGDTWTWHHKVEPYKMELVDMYAHGGFFHYGGFSQWGDMNDGDSDD